MAASLRPGRTFVGRAPGPEQARGISPSRHGPGATRTVRHPAGGRKVKDEREVAERRWTPRFTGSNREHRDVYILMRSETVFFSLAPDEKC